MTNYNYYEAVKNDVLNYINNEIDIKEALEEANNNIDELYENLHEALWVNDAVTGNGSGSYTFNTYRAEEYLCHNFDLLKEALTELGGDLTYLEKGAEACDVTIRCYLLGSAILEAIEELNLIDWSGGKKNVNNNT